MNIWNEKTELRENSLNKFGYYDLEKMEYIFVKMNDKNLLNRIDSEKLGGIKKSTIYSWKRGIRKIPFKNATEIFGEKEIFELIKLNKLSLFPKVPTLPTEFSNVVNFTTPIDPDVYINSKVSKKELSKLKKFGTIVSYEKQKGYRLLSRGLNRFLKTFYQYKREINEDFLRLIDNFLKFIDDYQNLELGLIGPLIISDGSNANRRNRLGISFFGNGIELHAFLAVAFYKEFNVFPTCFFVPANTTNVTYYNNLEHQKCLKKLFNIFRNFKTSPKRPVTKNSIKKYLMEEQPTLKNLLIANKRTKQLAIRTIFSAEGTVFVDSRFNPRVSVGCAHPTLNNEIRKILNQLKIYSRKIKNARTWSGIGRLEISRKKEVEKFIKIGGFLPSVKVTTRSKLYNGIEKQKLLLTFLEISEDIKNGKITVDKREDFHKEVLARLAPF